MPDFPIIDAHVHLWDPQHFRMSWLDNNELLNKRYSVEEYREHTKNINVEAMVYLEVGLAPHYAILEPRWVLERAKEDPRIQGIVAAAPLEYGEQVRAYLKELVSFGPLIKGIRRITQGDPPPFCLQPSFIKGTQILSELGLTCDLCINHTQLANTIELVRQCPKTQFIVDHIAKPNIKEHVLEPWRKEMKEMAALPNVICKLSGVPTEADRANWTEADLKPYVSHVLEVFGEDRVVFGGDWPVALLATTYERWVKTVDALTAHLSPAARKKIFAENARRFYRLQKA
ncbi:MAG TPA: amidohydrolase family protein [Planctomycetota bacterium]|nr:amidohydrolase family protein [Planctomycetota bacterium]